MYVYDNYTYRVKWSSEDGEFVGLCAEFPLLSWLESTPEKARHGIRRLVAEVLEDESVPSEVSAGKAEVLGA